LRDTGRGGRRREEFAGSVKEAEHICPKGASLREIVLLEELSEIVLEQN
jgi:hypothetical protein